MYRLRRWGPGLLLLSPSLILLGIFVYGFLGWNLRVSLSDWRGLRPSYSYEGFDNYSRLTDDNRFTDDVENVIIFTAVFVIGALLVGFVQVFGNYYLPDLALAFMYLVMLAVLVVRPGGLLGKEA